MTSEVLRNGQTPTDTQVEKSMLKEKSNGLALRSKEPKSCTSLFGTCFANLRPLASMPFSQAARLAVSLNDPAQLPLKRTALRAAA